jgi:hypothetical protein
MRHLLLTTMIGFTLGAVLALPRVGRALNYGVAPCDTQIDLELQSITIDGQSQPVPVDPIFNVSSAVHEPGASLTSSLWDPDLEAELVQSWRVAP